MPSALYQFVLPPVLLKRGFWLYIWKITQPSGMPILYVGMTGDTGSYNAQSPINRVSAHLSNNPHSNALRRHAEDKKIDLEACRRLELAAFGPISKVPKNDKEAYRAERRKVAALEKALWLALEKEGHQMLNGCPRCTIECSAARLATVRDAFAGFLKLTADETKQRPGVKNSYY